MAPFGSAPTLFRCWIQAPFCSSTNMICNQLPVLSEYLQWEATHSVRCLTEFLFSFRFSSVLKASFSLAENAGVHVCQLSTILFSLPMSSSIKWKLLTSVITTIENRIVFRGFVLSNQWAVHFTSAVECVLSREKPTGYRRCQTWTDEAKTLDKRSQRNEEKDAERQKWQYWFFRFYFASLIQGG